MGKEKLAKFYKSHKSEIIGAGIGAVFAIFVIILGFWNTIFIGLCTFVGYYIGHRFSSKDQLIELLDRILPPGKI